ncbi:hypothetical protein Tco_1517537 [Tanacetum coccineum]
MIVAELCDFSSIRCKEQENCPKNVKNPSKNDASVGVQSDGFTYVIRKGNKGKNNGHKSGSNQPKTRPVGGIRLTKPKPSFYRPKSGPMEHNATSNSGPNASRPNDKGKRRKTGSLKPADTSEMEHGDGNGKMDDPIITPSSAMDATEASSSNPSSSFGDYVFGEPGESDEDEVYERYTSSMGGGHQLEDDELDFSDGHEAQVYDLPGELHELCDLIDVWINRRVRK